MSSHLSYTKQYQREKAVGIDGMTKDEYEANLKENLADVVARLKRKAYKPKPAKVVEIPKENGKTRPISIYCYEDKLIQEAVRRILEAVFEPHFYEEMMGFRPNRGCHKAIKELNRMIETEKTRLIPFGRFAKRDSEKEGRKPPTFTFLGFTHYCSESKNGKFRVKRKTSKKKFGKKCKEVNKTIKSMRTKPLKEIIRKLNQILIGYYHYYGMTDNIKGISNFQYRTMKSLYYWLNRRSQKRSYTWDGFNEMLKENPLVRPRIYVSIYE